MTVSGSTSSPATPTGTALPDTPWAEMVEQMWATIQRHYRAPDSGLYLEHAPSRIRDGGKEIADLWPILGLLSGANARAIAGIGPSADDDFRAVFDVMGAYLNTDTDPAGYDSFPRALGGGDIYYDDNQWLGIDGVLAWRHLREQRFLDAAHLTWELSLSGWDDTMGGGIYWRQNDRTTKNACSNGPAAVLGMLLYEETGDRQILDWVVRILDWNRQLRDPDTGVYLDALKDDGTIDRATYTYNSGTPLHAFALLYRATGDAAYLDEARTLARDAFAHFAPDATRDEATGVRLWPTDPWFNSILFRGYIALLDVDPEPDPTYVRAMLDFTRLGWGRVRDANGLMNRDWSGHQPAPANAWLLDQAALLEFAATAHRLGL
ncbi:MAG TPA: glycoside hydrolase family 76 protein [Thermomicrobiales bacterium]|jgi:hypothetical protein|nr:glycoside hydrolase family 76 protein [Thermomicrobiales bacterium]